MRRSVMASPVQPVLRMQRWCLAPFLRFSDLEVDALDLAVLVDVLDVDGHGLAHPGPLDDFRRELEHVGGLHSALGREHALALDLALLHQDGPHRGRYPRPLARARALGVHREHELVRLPALGPLYRDIEAAARPGDPRLLDEAGAPRDD